MDPVTIGLTIGSMLTGSGLLGGGSKQTIQTAAPAAGGQANPGSAFQLPRKMEMPQANLEKELDALAEMIATATAQAAPSQPQGQQKGKFQDLLTQLPPANSPIWALLGLGAEEEKRSQPAPIAGGPQGQLVQGFNMPQRQGIGSILASIPRANYG